MNGTGVTFHLSAFQNIGNLCTYCTDVSLNQVMIVLAYHNNLATDNKDY